jgi:hypothetical protein
MFLCGGQFVHEKFSLAYLIEVSNRLVYVLVTSMPWER